MFPRDPREEEAEEVLALVSPPGSDDPAVGQAIDTVARRLVRRRADMDGTISWGDFFGIGEPDWERIEARALELIKELDRGQGPFEAAYELLKQRAERES
jgi:hypothetical protein